MGTLIPFSGRRELATVNHCIALADDCILRQLHPISYLDRRSADLSSAADALKHMLIAHHRLAKCQEQLERQLARRAAC
jgi:hypothetical protein